MKVAINKFYACTNLVKFNFLFSKLRLFKTFLRDINFNFKPSAFVKRIKLNGSYTLTEN